MSYCRWSSDNFMCDVYVYEDVCGGWTTHVAGNRTIIAPVPEFPWRWLPRLGAEWDHKARRMRYPSRWHAALAHCIYTFATWANRPHHWSLRWLPRRAIGLPHDGDSFNDPSPGDCADRLESLRDMGYRVPVRAILALRSEQADVDAEALA
jgi:hypothetical protein